MDRLGDVDLRCGHWIESVVCDEGDCDAVAVPSVPMLEGVRKRADWSIAKEFTGGRLSRMSDSRRRPTCEPGGLHWLRHTPSLTILPMNTPPKFLVLLDDAPRALLFDGGRQLLGEVIEEDGFIVDSLLRTASECPCPDDIMLRAVVPPPAPADRVRCFELR